QLLSPAMEESAANRISGHDLLAVFIYCDFFEPDSPVMSSYLKALLMMNIKHFLCFLILSVTGAAVAQQISAPEPQTGTIIGTVTDVNSGTVPGATVNLESSSLPDPQRLDTNDNGFFQLDHLKPGTPYHVTISASGFANW